MLVLSDDRPRLTTRALRRWLPPLVRRAPDLLSAYALPGRLSPRMREAAMLGVTSVNRCEACARVHERWGQAAGLEVHDPLGFEPADAAAYAYGQELAVAGPGRAAPPATLSARHRRELEAAAILMELANLAGNRFLRQREAPGGRRAPQLAGALSTRLYDVVMGAADRAGLHRARRRAATGASGDVLEIGIGTGLNLAAYPDDVRLHAIDPSEAALVAAARRARRLGRPVTLMSAEAEALPYPDDTFDVVLGTFVLCSVDDVTATLHEGRRVLRPGGTMRFVEHARSEQAGVARLQGWLAPVWFRASGGCRLDHDVRSSIEGAGLRIVEARSRGNGLLVELVAVPA
jgi:AhpD family alkylhydroperoxidase